MTQAETGEFEAFWRQELASLLWRLVRSGASYHDAEDAAQEAFVEVYKRWSALDEPSAYLHVTACNERTRLAGRPRRDLDHALRGPDRWVGLDSAEDVYHGLDAGAVEQLLALLTDQQRKVVERLCEDLPAKDVADALSLDASTIRGHCRDARTRLRAEGIDAGLPLVIRQSWARARSHGVNTEDDTTAELLPDDEVGARRQESPFWGACAWARDSLNAAARDARQMAVIVDRDGVVLSREGDRKVIEVADELSFAPGAGWGEASVGCNAIGVSLATGRPAEVVGAQHQKHDQRSLSCWAAAVIHPTDKQIVGILNLTERSRRPNPAALDELTKTAHQLQQQLAAC